MSGHYEAAEALLADAEHTPDRERARLLAEMAQAHATLAQCDVTEDLVRQTKRNAK